MWPRCPAVAARDRRRVPRHLQARPDPALDVGALRGRGIEHWLSDSSARLVVTDTANRAPDPGRARRTRAGDGRRLRGWPRRLTRVRASRHVRRRSCPALLLVGHHRPGKGILHAHRYLLAHEGSSSAMTSATASSSTARAKGVGGRHLPAVGPRYGAVAPVQARKGGYDPEEHLRFLSSTGWRTCSPRR